MSDPKHLLIRCPQIGLMDVTHDMTCGTQCPQDMAVHTFICNELHGKLLQGNAG